MPKISAYRHIFGLLVELQVLKGCIARSYLSNCRILSSQPLKVHTHATKNALLQNRIRNSQNTAHLYIL
jgi:hypothetical protein